MSSAGAELPPSSPQAARARELIESPAFRALVRRRWAVSFSLLLALFVTYYGFILLIASARTWVSQRVSDAPGAVTTIAIPLGLGAILAAWVLTAAYVAWANGSYDPEVQRLKDLLKR